MEKNNVLAALAALSQETRLDAYRLLVQAGPGGLSAGALAEALGVPQTTLSFHLTQLANAGLALQQRQGRSIIYSADFGCMNDLIGFLTENCCGGQLACSTVCETEPVEERQNEAFARSRRS